MRSLRYERQVMYMKKVKTTAEISGRRWNQIINAVNNSKGPEVIEPPLDEVELDLFKRLDKQKRDADKANGYESFFAPVEIEYDDACLDIYND